MVSRPFLIALFLAPLVHAGCGAAQPAPRPPEGHGRCAFGAPFVRTDLFFGRDRKNAPPVSDDEWAEFVDVVVTPLFKDGLTVLDAGGQYLATGGSLVKEQSKVLVLLHDGHAAASSRIDEICKRYKDQFNQESVLRVDTDACVAF